MATKNAAGVKVAPLADRVVVKPLEEAEQMRGGLYIPDTAKEKPQQGEIVAVGPGRFDDKGNRLPVEVKVGDKVLYGKYSGTEVTVEGENYLILRESDVLAVVG
ncbi:MAG TPA: co-chaperone GroES [Acidimicrobiales bacterium]|nr:co-chaperone GroES [Acidimicrobiales bacterium]